METLGGNKHLNQRRIKVKIIVDVVIWLSVGLPGFYLFLRATPHEQGFFCNDISLSYPYIEETVSTSMLIAIGFIISCFMIALVEVLNCADSKCRRGSFATDTAAYCSKRYIVFLVGIAIQLLIVEVIKNMMGVLRPNFFDVCKPAFNASLCPGFITEYTCIGKDHVAKEIRNSRQSFPSGHSAFSMYIAAFFCMYVQKRLNVTCSTLLKFILQTSLIVMSVLCGLGRIRDYQHHVSDVVAGFAIGIAVAASLYKIVCVDALEDKNEIKSYSIDSENMTEQCDICLPNDHNSGEEAHLPTPLLINEKLASSAKTQATNKPYVHGYLTDSDHAPNATV